MYSKKLKTAAQLLIVVCLGVIAFVASCKKSEKDDIFPITIESIDIIHEGARVHLSPSEETADKDTVFIRLHGYIGPNQCCVLYRDPTLYTQPGTKNKHIIEAEGIQNKPAEGTGCKQEESLLDHTLRIWFTEEEGAGEHIFYTKDKSGDMVELGRIEVVD